MDMYMQYIYIDMYSIIYSTYILCMYIYILFSDKSQMKEPIFQDSICRSS